MCGVRLESCGEGEGLLQQLAGSRSNNTSIDGFLPKATL